MAIIAHIISTDMYDGQLRLENSSVAQANELRRIILQSVPTLAIETVIYFTNTSILQSDYLAHRLGLIPLVVNEKMSKLTTVNFTLECDLPSDSKEILEVFSDQLVSDNSSVSARPDILLLKLKGGQSVKLVAKAVVGTGKVHAKWSPVCKSVFDDDPHDQSTFIITIKTVGGLTPKQVFKSAISILSIRVAD